MTIPLKTTSEEQLRDSNWTLQKAKSLTAVLIRGLDDADLNAELYCVLHVVEDLLADCANIAGDFEAGGQQSAPN